MLLQKANSTGDETLVLHYTAVASSNVDHKRGVCHCTTCYCSKRKNMGRGASSLYVAERDDVRVEQDFAS